MPEKPVSKMPNATINTIDAKASKQQLRRLQSLSLITQTAMSSRDMGITAMIMLEQINKLFGTDAAAFWSYTHAVNTLELIAWLGSGVSPTPTPITDPATGLPGTALHSKHPIHAARDLEDLSFIRPEMIADRGLQAYLAVKLAHNSHIVGIVECYLKDPDIQPEGWREDVVNFCNQCALTLDMVTIYNHCTLSNQSLKKALEDTITSYANALDLHEHKKMGHANRLAQTATNLARDLGLPENKISIIKRGALLHDLGNIAISDEIFLKPGPLTEDEWEIIRQHTKTGFYFLRGIEFLKPSLDILHSHHERWNGTGYPEGLVGEQIPFHARIFAVADTWECLRADRPYRPAYNRQKTLAYIEEQSGKAFDPEIVKAFLENPPEEFNQSASRKAKLLIVDDEERVTHSLARSLRNDFDVVTINSAQEALALLHEQTFQIVLTDQRMPGITGIQLLRQLHEIQPEAAGLLISAYLDSDVLSEAINLGNVFGFIGKPWDHDNLQRRLTTVSAQVR